MSGVKRVVALMMVLSLGVRLWLATRDIELLVVKCLSDDAFYGFSLARNFALGLGATFDGITHTNGFPPLFFFFMAPVFYIFGDNPETAVSAALTLMQIFDVATGYLLYRILMRIADWRGAVIGCGFWLLNPCLMLVTQTGVEASIYTFFDALCLLLYILFLEGSAPRKGRLFALGLATGLAVLARSDAIFWALPFMAGIMADGRGPMRQRLGRLALFCCLAGAVIAPWILWNILQFGMPGPVSGYVQTYRARQLFLQQHGRYLTPAILAEIWKWGWNSLHTIATSSGLWIGPFFAVAALVLFRIISSWARRGRRISDPVFVSIVYVVLTVGFYSVYFWQTRPWYYHATLMVFCVWLGQAGSQWIAMIPSRVRHVWVAALAVLIAVSSARGVKHWRNGLYPWQSDYVEVARRLPGILPPNERIGSFNAGIYRFFSGLPVINIDGCVNNEAYHAMRNKSLFTEYLRERKIRYLVDQEYVVRMYWELYGPKADLSTFLTPIINISVRWCFEDRSTPANIVIYEVKQEHSREDAGFSPSTERHGGPFQSLS